MDRTSTNDSDADLDLLRRVAATPSNPDPATLVGAGLFPGAAQEVGGYELQSRVGAGGMGVVFAARDPKLGRTVALKLLRPGSRGTQERLFREARALARVAHPNVVTIHEVGTHEGIVFVAMEYIPGHTVREWMQGARTVPQIAAVFSQAARGLAAAHREGVVHRDFKPDNAVIGRDERVRVLDFGVALSRDSEALTTGADAPTHRDVNRTATGGRWGTLPYMPPEQLRGEPVGPQADVYAFAVSLYEALHRRRPYPVESPEALRKAVDGGPANLSWHRDVPAKVVALTRRALEPDPLRRLPTLDPLIAALDDVASGRRASTRLAVGLVVGLGVAGGGAAWLATMVAGTAAPRPADDAPAGGLLVCSPVTEDARDCDELTIRLESGGAGAEDRCAFRRACAEQAHSCPPRTHWDGTLGCALPLCEATTEGAEAVCEADGARCCLTAANVAYASAADGPAGEAARARGREWLARSCEAGDGFGCYAFGKAVDGMAEAITAFAHGCRLGNAQACRRIGLLPDANELVDASCNPHRLGVACDDITTAPAKLAYFAACSTVLNAVPSLSGADAFVTSFDYIGALQEGEHAALRRAHEVFLRRAQVEIRETWGELLGAPAPRQLSAQELHARIMPTLLDRPRDHAIEHKRAVQRLADERALIVPDPPAPALTPMDRVVRLDGTLGDLLQEAVADELGPSRSTQLRDRLGEWPGSETTVLISGACPPSNSVSAAD